MLALRVLIATACAFLVGFDSPATSASRSLTSTSRVVGTTRRYSTQLVTLTTSEATLVTTPEHPFAKVGAGWTRAIDLAVGDSIETRKSGTGARLLKLEMRAVPPTLVYNLTVSETHAYFVTPEGLLVHNVGCGGRPILAKLARRWQKQNPRSSSKPEDVTPAQLMERAQQRRDAERARIAAIQSARDRPFDDVGGTMSCAVCALAGLSDFDKLSTFLERHTESEIIVKGQRRGLLDHEMVKAISQLGLSSSQTPKPARFPDTRDWDESYEPGSGLPPPKFEHWPAVNAFMSDPRANTFVVIFKYFDGSYFLKHAVIAIRQEDGSITYMDLQRQPPTTYDALDPHVLKVYVIPTGVDWRSNRQLYLRASDVSGRQPVQAISIPSGAPPG